MNNPLPLFENWLRSTNDLIYTFVSARLDVTHVTQFYCGDGYLEGNPPSSPYSYCGAAKTASHGSGLSVSALLMPNLAPGFAFNTQLEWDGAVVLKNLTLEDPYHVSSVAEKPVTLINTVLSKFLGMQGPWDALELDFWVKYPSKPPQPGPDVTCKLVLINGFAPKSNFGAGDL